MAPHPAKFSNAVLHAVRPLARGQDRILDPFAGTGLVHELGNGFNTWGVEIEPEWAADHPRTIVGDATALPFPDWAFSAVITSPAYGNRMADHHDARDLSKRHTYRHYLGRQLHENSSGRMQWGEEYRALHVAAWAECYRVLRPFGILVLNISDHVRKNEVVPVTDWHCETLRCLDFIEVDRLTIATPRMRHGQNGDARVAHEHVIVFLRRSSGSAVL